MTAPKVMKNSSIPIGAKLGSVVGMGAASLIGYQMVQNNLNRTKFNNKNLNIEADKLNATVSATSSNTEPNNNFVNKYVARNNSGEKYFLFIH
jgi:hypothetical protein